MWRSHQSGSATSLSVDETTDAARWLIGTAGDTLSKEVTRHVEEVLTGTFVEKDNEGTTLDIEPPPDEVVPPGTGVPTAVGTYTATCTAGTGRGTAAVIITPRPVASRRPAEPPSSIGLPVTTAVVA